MIYILIFLASSFLLYLAEKKCNRHLSKILVIFGVLLPAVLAGLRDSGIGTDVEVYGVYAYNQAFNSTSFWGYFSNASTSEIGYYFLTYMVSRFFKDYHWGLFAYSLFTQLFVYSGFSRYKKQMNTQVWFGMLLYYFTLYNYSLNLMRQSIAFAIVFYASSFLMEKKYKSFVLLIVLSMLFHTSALVGFVLLPMYLILQQGRNINEKKQIVQGIVFIVVLVFVLISMNQIIQKLVNLGLVRETYLLYLSGGKYSVSSGSVSIFLIFPDLVFIVLTILNYKRLEKRNCNALLFLMISLIVIISDFIPLYARYMERIGFYFIPLQLVNVDNMSFCVAKKSRKIWYVLILIMLGVVWYREFIVLGYAETYPYKFFWN